MGGSSWAPAVPPGAAAAVSPWPGSGTSSGTGSNGRCPAPESPHASPRRSRSPALLGGRGNSGAGSPRPPAPLWKVTQLRLQSSADAVWFPLPLEAVSRGGQTRAPRPAAPCGKPGLPWGEDGWGEAGVMGTCCCPGCGSLQPAAGLNQVPWPRFPTQEGINGFFFLGTSFGLVRLHCGGAGVQVYPALSSSRALGLTSSCPLTQRRVTKTPSEERGPAPARWPQRPAKHPESLGDNCGVREEGDGLICHRFRMAPRVLLHVPPQWCGQPGSQ